MKTSPRLPLAVLPVLFAFSFGMAAARAAPSTYAVLIGGGFTFNSTYLSDYAGITDLKAALVKRGVPESRIATYFAEGCRPNGTVRIAAVLSKPCIGESNARPNVLAGLARIAREIPSGGTLVIGISTHGEKNGDLDLQDHTKLSLSDLKSFIAPLEARAVHTILISTACYSGNLHRLASAHTCAFTESDEKHLTSEFLFSKSMMSVMARSLADGSDFLTAFENARKIEAAKRVSLNSHYTNGMDFMSESLFKSEAPETPSERLTSWRRKTGYDRFDVRFLDLFAPPTAYFDAIECAKTSL